jgi:hypothetical protein
MSFNSPSIAAFWNRLVKIHHILLGLHPPQKKRILYGFSTLDTTPQQLAKLPTIYKTYLAMNDDYFHTPDYQHTFHMRLQYRLYIEMQ